VVSVAKATPAGVLSDPLFRQISGIVTQNVDPQQIGRVLLQVPTFFATKLPAGNALCAGCGRSYRLLRRAANRVEGLG